MSKIPQVGDVLVRCWGYEAMIASFAIIVEKTPKSVKIIDVPSLDTHMGDGMTWTSVPDMSYLDAPEHKPTPVLRRFRLHDETFSVSAGSREGSFYPWSGQPISCYNYH